MGYVSSEVFVFLVWVFVSLSPGLCYDLAVLVVVT